MLRVLHFIYDDPRNPWVAGGGAVRVYELYRRLADRVASVTVATGTYPGARNEEIDGVRYIRLGSPWPYAWSRLTYTIAANRLLARGEYDAAVYDFSTYTPLRLPPERAIGITVHHVTGGTATERWGTFLGRMVAEQELRRLRTGRIYSATSRITLERLRTILGSSAEIRLIEAGVPDELFALRRREADYLLFFGRLDWFQKGLDVLLETMALLVRRWPDLRLKVAGRGKDGQRLLEAAREMGIRDHIEVLGPVSDAERDRLFAGARVLLMPSRFEGFGMVAAEAMAAGIPLVASETDSLPEVVSPPEGGILVPPEDAGAMAAAVDKLLGDAGLRRRLGQSARASAERFHWDQVADQHLAFLESIHAATALKEKRD